MDTLTFNSPIILRHLTFSEARKMPIDVIKLDAALEGLELDMDQASFTSCHILLKHVLMYACCSSSTSVFFADAITSSRSKVLAQRPLTSSSKIMEISLVLWKL
jgi:hypothetical protein